MPNTPTHAVPLHCGPGWQAILQPVVTDILRHGGSIREVRSYGRGVVFLYRLPTHAPLPVLKEVHAAVTAACHRCRSHCEACGVAVAVDAAMRQVLCRRHHVEHFTRQLIARLVTSARGALPPS